MGKSESLHALALLCQPKWERGDNEKEKYKKNNTKKAMHISMTSDMPVIQMWKSFVCTCQSKLSRASEAHEQINKNTLTDEVDRNKQKKHIQNEKK